MMSLNIAALALAVVCSAGVALVGSAFLWPRASASTEPDLPQRRRIASERLRALLDEAGYARVSVGAFVVGFFAIGVGAFLVLFLVTPIPTLAFCGGAVALVAPISWLMRRRIRRAREREALWPDVADTLVSLLRSGSSLADAVTHLGQVMPASIALPARNFGERTRASANIGKCLDDLKAEWADPAADRIVEALKVTRDVGGARLTTVLRELSQGLRKDLAIRREVDARQSWIRVAAGIGASAPWAVVLLLATRSEAVRAYQSPAGATLIAGGLVVTVIAYRVMIRIGHVPPQKRWFA